jgi:release factor glutamine methyltransferase
MTIISESSVVTTLRAAGCVFAEDEARLLISAASSSDELASLVSRRAAGVPLEQILGWAEFCGLRIALEPGVFVPRRRTEFLAGVAVALALPGAMVVDMCCGSGAIGAVLTASVNRVEVHAVDIEPAAVRCARRNLPKAQVYQGDLYEPLPDRLHGRVNVLVANVPYVPTEEIELMPPEARLHEPKVALDGGTDGLDLVRRVSAGLLDWLAPDGSFLVETSRRQASEVVRILTAAGLTPRVAGSEALDATAVIARPA